VTYKTRIFLNNKIWINNMSMRDKMRYIWYKLRLYGEPPIYQHRRCEAVEERWKLMQQILTSDDHSLLDIGCNAGRFLELAADRGLIAWGIDRFENNLTRYKALQRVENNPRVGVMEATLTPENATHLPEFEVVLLLSVYHHWYAEFGKNNAEAMLHTLSGSNKILFEPPSTPDRYVDPYHDSKQHQPDAFELKNDRPIESRKPDFEPHNQEEIISYHLELFNSVFGETYSTELLGSSDRMGEERYMFAITKN
jgi:SAM-dependent methyltransferase